MLGHWRAWWRWWISQRWSPWAFWEFRTASVWKPFLKVWCSISIHLASSSSVRFLDTCLMTWSTLFYLEVVWAWLRRYPMRILTEGHHSPGFYVLLWQPLQSLLRIIESYCQEHVCPWARYSLVSLGKA